jgi:hypothetical protein
MSAQAQGDKTTQYVQEMAYDYVLIDMDRSKGDRRGDGKLNANFFGVVEGSKMIDNIRVSQRKLGKIGGFKVVEESAKGLVTRVELESKRISTIQGLEGEKHKLVGTKPVRTPRIVVSQKKAVKLIRVMGTPRGPDKGLKCAGRHRTSRLLWRHEYFIVYENGNRKQKRPMVYQALQFLFGSQLPEGVLQDMNDKQAREIWVLGIGYLPADYVRKSTTPHSGYIFHTELHDEDSDKALYGNCPELVRVENCMKWHAMSSVSPRVPRVVHADDVKTRRMHVVGRKLHYVCGVTAIQDLASQDFRLAPLARSDFVIYPEDRSGLDLNSPSMMWEHVDEIFSRIRECMSSARQGTSSASFRMPCYAHAHAFWKV